jgi:cysteine-rich secretory family protein
MRSHMRRLGPVLLVLTLIVGLAPSVGAADLDVGDAARAAAERHALDLTNQRRVARGLIRLRLDTRLTELARQRAQYMADTGNFSHTQSGGTTVFDMIGDANIRWYAAGEIIAWNTAAPLDYSAEFAVDGWMGSPSHKAIVLSSLYNYVGFGLAIAPDGTRYWAGVYLKGPDRTGGYARTGSFTKTYLSSVWARGTVYYSGGDIRLQVLTAGHRYFQTQWRVAGGSWINAGITTATRMTKWWRRGWTYEFRVRERDRNGNWGSWATKTLKP